MCRLDIMLYILHGKWVVLLTSMKKEQELNGVMMIHQLFLRFSTFHYDRARNFFSSKILKNWDKVCNKLTPHFSQAEKSTV